MNEMKTNTSKGIIASLIILSVVIIGLVSFIIYDKMNSQVVENEPETKENKKININSNDKLKEENKVEIEDTTQLLNEVTDVYKKAYEVINSHEVYSNYNESELSPYFTKKALALIEKNVSNSQISPAFFTGIFGHVNQTIRPLTIVENSENTVVATGQNINSQTGDNDNYPLYIIFKKDSNVWKIDLFE